MIQTFGRLPLVLHFAGETLVSHIGGTGRGLTKKQSENIRRFAKESGSVERNKTVMLSVSNNKGTLYHKFIV